MKSMILVAAMTMAANVAMATTFSCGFTEPFLTVTASDTDGVIFEAAADDKVACTKGGAVASSSKVAFVFPKQTEFEFTQLVINLNARGSDGSSDRVYSYEGVLKSKDATIYGGCELVK